MAKVKTTREEYRRKQQDTISLTILVKKDEIVEMKAKLKTLGVIIL
jgi:hypothetical protein